MSLSVVLPVHDDAERCAAGLALIAAPLAAAEVSLGIIELVIVDNASTSHSVDVISEQLRLFPCARLIRLPWKCGTGTALKAGVAAATADVVVFADVDHPAEFAYLSTVVELLNDADMVVTSLPSRAPHRERRNAASRLVVAAYERCASRLGASSLIGADHHLTALRTDVAKALFTLLQSPELAFDVEARVVAGAMGLRIVELTPPPSVGAVNRVGAERHRGQATHLREMAADLLRARGHRSRAQRAGVTGLSDITGRGVRPVTVSPLLIDLTEPADADRTGTSTMPSDRSAAEV